MRDPSSQRDQAAPHPTPQPQVDFKETLPSPSQIAPLIITSGKHAPRQPSRAGGFIKIVLGGLVGAVIAQLVIWWLPPPYRSDPLNLAHRVPANFHWLIPVEFRQNGLQVEGPPPAGSNIAEPAAGDPTVTEANGTDASQTPTDGVETPSGDGSESSSADAGSSNVVVPPEPGDEQYGVRNADVFSGLEIQAAVRDVQAAGARLAVAVELQRASLSQQWYRALENLAYRLTFANANDPTIVKQLEPIETLVRAAWTNDAQRLILLESQQRIWTASNSRLKAETPDGCLVIGEVLEVIARGPLFLTSIRLASGPKSVAVLSRIDPTARELNAYRPGDVIAVLGVLVNRPESDLIGFTGTEKHVVWGGRPIRLGPAPSP
jgi:hypothetical protein